ncbi:DUF6114 domain-containing protein [Streptomyces rubellomurinus]|uniref:DUF6114 domain-containing protein n=1 Tax=Streptomyces rubellomurinus (strain ATCC 31215) TaxID=359131 RepID=UPI000AA13EAE|nr:DUF6114 domain-containing protein [Streptomyces rubellomurinus]
MAEAVGEPEPGANDGSGGGSDAAASGTAAATAAPAGRAGTAVRRADWRGRRPFWGGLLVLLGGSEVLFTEKAPLPIVLHIGMQGLAGYLVPAVMVICGLLILFNPAQRLFYSILAVLASLGTWVTSNLGGFLLGMLLGVVGASLTFGWVPDQPLRRGRQRRWDRREQRRAAKAAGV